MAKSQATPIWQVDAFADKPFAGNPAAVCLLDQQADETWMQHVAAEMNLAETAFVVPTGQTNEFQLRWFTPTVEVDLCGHATLAAAHVLIEHLLSFLDVEATFIARSRFDIFVVADNPQTVVSLQPDFNRLGRIETRGIIVSAPSNDPDSDFMSRFFAPRCGIDEDPVTGSAHCCLAPYWSQRLKRNDLTGYQASRRGGTVHTRCCGDRVRLSGHAVTVMAGRLLG